MGHLYIFFLILCLPLNLNATVQTVAAFDIGTGKIKMHVASVDAESGQITTILAKSLPLSHDPSLLLGRDNTISEEAKEKILQNLKALQEDANVYAPSKSYAIATELFRKASNGQDIVRELEEATHIVIDIISPREEGIFGFMTASYEAGLDSENMVVWDIGSGSFQITYMDEGQYLVYSSHYGRHMVYELVKQNQIDDFIQSLTDLPKGIQEKIRRNGGRVVGIGAHPKEILNKQMHYTLEDLQIVQDGCSEMDSTYSDILLVQSVMKALSINEVSYQSSIAGNTTALFLTRFVT
jgi:exopolyphosphatase/guanosine-5'-triphosphate,3'-diphosphate pyrophosphatase